MNIYPEITAPDIIERELWLEDRRSGIGSTDAAPILGLSAWKQATEVYLDKLGALPDKRPTKGMRWGLKLEAAIAEAYTEETGINLFEPEEKIQRNVQFPWLICSLDRQSATRDLIVELKTCNAYSRKKWGESGTDEIPDEYLLQCTHQLAVTGAARADVAVLIGGQEFRIYHVDRNERLIASMLEREAEFWDMVKSETPPPVSLEHPRALEIVKAMYGIGQGGEIVLPDPDLVAKVEARAEAHERIKAAEADKDRATCELLAAMKEAGAARLADGTLLTRKEVHRAGYSVQPTSYVDFRVSRPKVKKARAS